MNNKLIPLVITLVVGIILAGSLLVPVLNDARGSFYNTVEYSNVTSESQIHLSAVTAETSNTLDVSSTGIVTNNGNIEYWEDTTYANVVLLTDLIYVSVTGVGAITVVTTSGSTTASSFSAVISAGELTYSVDGADAVTTTYAAGYTADPSGDFVSCTTSDPRYFVGDKFAQARYDNAFKAYVNGSGYSDGTEANMTVVSETVADTNNTVFKLTGIKYTSSKVLISLTVMENKVEYRYTDDPEVVSLLGAIAPIVIISLVVGAAGAIFYNRRD